MIAIGPHCVRGGLEAREPLRCAVQGEPWLRTNPRLRPGASRLPRLWDPLMWAFLGLICLRPCEGTRRLPAQDGLCGPRGAGQALVAREQSGGPGISLSGASDTPANHLLRGGFCRTACLVEGREGGLRSHRAWLASAQPRPEVTHSASLNHCPSSPHNASHCRTPLTVNRKWERLGLGPPGLHL